MSRNDILVSFSYTRYHYCQEFIFTYLKAKDTPKYSVILINCFFSLLPDSILKTISKLFLSKWPCNLLHAIPKYNLALISSSLSMGTLFFFSRFLELIQSTVKNKIEQKLEVPGLQKRKWISMCVRESQRENEICVTVSIQSLSNTLFSTDFALGVSPNLWGGKSVNQLGLSSKEYNRKPQIMVV